MRSTSKPSAMVPFMDSIGGNVVSEPAISLPASTVLMSPAATACGGGRPRRRSRGGQAAPVVVGAADVVDRMPRSWSSSLVRKTGGFEPHRQESWCKSYPRNGNQGRRPAGFLSACLLLLVRWSAAPPPRTVTDIDDIYSDREVYCSIDRLSDGSVAAAPGGRGPANPPPRHCRQHTVAQAPPRRPCCTARSTPAASPSSPRTATRDRPRRRSRGSHPATSRRELAEVHAADARRDGDEGADARHHAGEEHGDLAAALEPASATPSGEGG